MNIRTRIAPSPTGMLHIGTLRTVLFDYALAKKTGGQFVIRIEDTDQKRFVEGSVEEIYEVLESYGLKPDEGPIYGGDLGPYIQSERIEIYQDYAQKLIDSGHAYYCFLEGEELEILQKQFRGKGFRSPFRDTPIEDSLVKVKNGEKYVIRLKIPENEVIEYEDGLQGKMKFDSNLVSDEILIKSNGMASYHLAVVVDDSLMKISHVFRGIEWLPSTPKQIYIHKFLGIEMPPYFHLPVILDPDGGKLSKRKGTVSAKQFLVEGYLPEAVLNFLMLLGWSAPIKREFGEKERELFSVDEFVQLFDLKDLNKSNPVFNREKLLWFNKEYLKQLDLKDIVEKYKNWLNRFGESDIKQSIINDDDLEKKVLLVRERSTILTDITSQIEFFYKDPVDINWDIKQLEKVSQYLEGIRKDLFYLHTNFDNDSTQWTHEEWEKGIRSIGDKYGAKHGDVFMVLRVAITGKPFSPSMFESLQILGKERILERLR